MSRFVHDKTLMLRPTDLTLDDVRSKVSGYHFSKECLTKGEREILALAESLLFFIDNQPADTQIPFVIPEVESCNVVLLE